MSARSTTGRVFLSLLAASLVTASLVVLPVGPAAPTDARASGEALPLGDRDLPEGRSVVALAPGVELTQIVRGAVPAAPADIPTTRRGPWRVSVLTIDPRLARGHLQATYGPNLSQVEPTSALVPAARALAGVNASFFAFGKSPRYPGEPVGLGLYRGVVMSEPAATRTEVDLLVDARTNAVRLGRLTWTGNMKNRRTDKTLRLEFLNHPPVVPAACRELTDPTACRKSGDVVHVQQRFGRTPAGPGVEVVLDRSGCVVRRTKTRGTVLAAGQDSLQATGRQTKQLLALTDRGCLSRRVTLYDEKRKKVRLHAGMFGVAGRYRLTQNGRVVVPAGRGSFFARHPRTFAGTGAGGKIMLVTIDGRRPDSVGSTLAETAAVARSLGLRDAVNLDGGGSTTMSVRGGLVNQPSGSSERAVGDALVYVDAPLA